MHVRFVPSSDLDPLCPLAHCLTPAELVTRYAPEHLAPDLAEELARLTVDLLGAEPEVLEQPAADPALWVVVDRQVDGPPLAYDLGPTYLLLQPRAELLTRAMASALERTGTRLAHHIRRR
ncbi:hypothetical protein ACIRPH_30105 [Nocardiopsis sp. NPDC101807]|uniref:hypothetical protein n=1 Tax=Nocardiopsis sp. NPDC101807 TaxID=3364339 RepID=UPI00381B0302